MPRFRVGIGPGLSWLLERPQHPGTLGAASSGCGRALPLQPPQMGEGLDHTALQPPQCPPPMGCHVPEDLWSPYSLTPWRCEQLLETFKETEGCLCPAVQPGRAPSSRLYASSYPDARPWAPAYHAVNTASFELGINGRCEQIRPLRDRQGGGLAASQGQKKLQLLRQDARAPTA
ncbi:unnamed protein product [Rangifer tarandus platyrhynchus]|uniref:Uncharacterized protein n=2 Tax=Rangifer tarandus platyrhynchus TaxID=3082113 RepID=A0ABN8ZTY1_RANTA|nr:unnamed protein product [Rangifer tarandus platyrhynchus]CAI9709403.1 unnamed protein product [Rangifer tarandus platyrhynchus]